MSVKFEYAGRVGDVWRLAVSSILLGGGDIHLYEYPRITLRERCTEISIEVPSFRASRP